MPRTEHLLYQILEESAKKEVKFSRILNFCSLDFCLKKSKPDDWLLKCSLLPYLSYLIFKTLLSNS